MASRFEIALAGPDDEAALRQRMADDRMEGRISLSFRREPDYFLGCAVQGERSQVIKCTDIESGQIVGLGARHFVKLFVNGKETWVGYLSDLRADPAIRRRTLLARGYAYFRSLHESEPLPLYFSVILDGNDEAVSALTSARAGLPVYKDFGRILTPAIYLDRHRAEQPCEGVVMRRGSTALMPQVFAFLEKQNARRQFAPSYRLRDLGSPRLQGLVAEDFYIAFENQRVVGCVAAWDQSEFRQTHIERYSTALRCLRPVYNLAARFSALHPLPEAGEKLRYLYLAMIASEDNRRDIFATLLRTAYRDRRSGGCQFMIVGLHEQDPLCPVLDDYRRIEAGGRLFLIYYPDMADKVVALDKRIPYIEMAAV